MGQSGTARKGGGSALQARFTMPSRDRGFREGTVPSGDLRSRLASLGFVETAASPLSFDRWPAGGVVEVVGTRAALGTRVSLTVVVPAAPQGEAAIATAFDELDRLAGIFSRHDPHSALSALNDAGRLLGPPPELSRVASRALGLHAATRGAFDVTVKPVLDLLAARLPAAPPTDAEFAERVALVDARNVRLAGGSIRFAREGMGMTLDGIAKGYIVDRMAAALERLRIRRFLIDAGGDIRVRGSNARDAPWVIGVRDPAGGEGFPEVITLPWGAVATSGGYERFYDAERRYHHIVSPGTGRSPGEIASASVAAPDAITADALATAVFVLGADQGLALIDRLPRCAALVLDAAGRRRRSRRWAALAAPLPEGTPS